MFCRNCGQELKAGAAFCSKCGTPTGIQNRQPGGIGTVGTVGIGGTAGAMGGTSAVMPSPAGKNDKKKGGKIVCIVIIVVCLLLSAGAAGWFIVQRMNKDESDRIMSDEDTEQEEEEPEAEEETVPEEVDQEAENTPEVEAEEPEEEETAANEAEPEVQAEERDETGIHTYDLIVEDVTWTEAYQNCLDRGGYLVRINSEEEYQAILRQIDEEDMGNIKFWLGGIRDSAGNYEYRWIYEDGTYGNEILNEEEPYVSYWLAGEPSFYDDYVSETELCMNMFYVSKEKRWVWNDVPEDVIAVADFYAGTVGYICEYED